MEHYKRTKGFNTQLCLAVGSTLVTVVRNHPFISNRPYNPDSERGQRKLCTIRTGNLPGLNPFLATADDGFENCHSHSFEFSSSRESQRAPGTPSKSKPTPIIRLRLQRYAHDSLHHLGLQHPRIMLKVCQRFLAAFELEERFRFRMVYRVRSMVPAERTGLDARERRDFVLVVRVVRIGDRARGSGDVGVFPRGNQESVKTRSLR